MKYDYKQLYECHASFFRAHPQLKRAALLLNILLTGLFFAVYGGFLLYAIATDYPPHELTLLIGLPLLCLLIVSVLRLAIDKPRPYSDKGAGIEPLVTKKKNENKSFPSRHAASALVIALTILPYCPLLGAALLVLSLPVCYLRFTTGLHYPLDIFIGALIGVACGAIGFFI